MLDGFHPKGTIKEKEITRTERGNLWIYIYFLFPHLRSISSKQKKVNKATANIYILIWRLNCLRIRMHFSSSFSLLVLLRQQACLQFHETTSQNIPYLKQNDIEKRDNVYKVHSKWMLNRRMVVSNNECYFFHNYLLVALCSQLVTLSHAQLDRTIIHYCINFIESPFTLFDYTSIVGEICVDRRKTNWMAAKYILLI